MSRRIDPRLIPFAPLPHAVLSRSDITPAAKLIFAALADLPPDRLGRRRATRPKLAGICALSISTVDRAGNCLARVNLLRIVRRRGRAAIYELTLAGMALPKVGQNDAPSAQNDPPFAQNDPPFAQNDTPARGRTFSRTSSTPRGIPPLVWEWAFKRLCAAYAEVHGPDERPPARWREKLAAELRADRMPFIERIDADLLRAAERRARQSRRNPGFAWLAIVDQERQGRRADRRAQQASAPAAPGQDDKAAADQAEAAEARLEAMRMEHFARLSDEEREGYRAQVRQDRFAPRRPELVDRLAALLAWRDYESRPSEVEACLPDTCLPDRQGQA